MAIRRHHVQNSFSNARVIRYRVRSNTYNDRNGKISGDCTALKKTSNITGHKIYNFRNMATLLHNLVSTTRPYYDHGGKTRYETMHGPMAIRAVPSYLSSLSCYCLHCYSSVHTDNGLLQDPKNTTNQARSCECADWPADWQHVVHACHTATETPAAYQDFGHLSFCLSSVLYSARSDDAYLWIFRHSGFEHECLSLHLSIYANFVLFETCHESYYSLCHKLWVSPLKLSTYHLSIIMLGLSTTWPGLHTKSRNFLELLGYQKNFKNFKGFSRKMKDFCRIFRRFSRNVVRLPLIFSTAIVIHTVEPQVGQARNMSIGEHRHSKYKDLYGKNTYRFCNLQKWNDFNKKLLTFLKCVLRPSCLVHGPIYGRFMGFWVNGFLSL